MEQAVVIGKCLQVARFEPPGGGNRAVVPLPEKKR
jgi:hypothetical protein